MHPSSGELSVTHLVMSDGRVLGSAGTLTVKARV